MTGLIRILSVVLLASGGPALAQAVPPERSLIPIPRPDRAADIVPVAATDLPQPPGASRVIIEVIEEPALTAPLPSAPDAVTSPVSEADPAVAEIASLVSDAIAEAEPGEITVVPLDDPAPTEAEAADVAASTSGVAEISPLATATSPRPRARGDVPPEFAARAARLRAIAEAETAELLASDPEFRAWITEFQTRARAAGIQQVTLDRAFEGVELNGRVMERDRNQAEFSRALWDYLDSAVSSERISNGRAALAEWRTTLGRIEETYQVEAEVVVAVWGLESAYGATRGSTDIIEAMATLAFDGRRTEFFEAQLMAALQILQSGDTRPRNMTGSWAGAMGHTQFMPTSYLEYAQDFTGDGRRDIWGDNPVDALASTAHYLAEHGWTYGQPWGLEVTLPEGFDYRLAGEQERITAPFWNGQGVRLVDGGEIPDHGPASILLPAGANGVALVVYNNFRVIERYNPADAYVIAIGHLSDRIEGGPAFEAGWPRGDRALSFDERQELQERLQAAGHYSERIDGIIGPRTIAAVREFQAQVGVTPDGYASLSILERLRRG